MTAEITHHLAAARGMADVNRIFQVEMIGDGLQIVGVMVHVVSAAGLSRATMSAPITRNDAETFTHEKKHLRVPVVGRQRPTMAEDDGLSFAPVFIIDVDVSSVFFSDSYVWHGVFSLLLIAYCRPRFISDRNQVRRSVSSIQTSIRLAVATSRCSSHTLCASRSRAASVWLSSASSAIMSAGSTYSTSLSRTRWVREMWPIDLSVSPPIFRIRSAIGSVMAKSWSACSSRSRW